MPHDRDGRVVRVGASVHVPARVVRVDETEQYCNLVLETSQPMWPGTHRTTLTLNAKQVVVQETPAVKGGGVQ